MSDCICEHCTLRRAGPELLKALQNAVIFLDVAAGYVPDTTTELEFPTGEKFKGRSLASVIKDVAADARAAIAKAAPPRPAVMGSA